MKKHIIWIGWLAIILCLLCCGGGGASVTDTVPQSRTIPFEIRWNASTTIRSARVFVYSSNQAVASTVINTGQPTGSLTIPNISVSGLRFHADAFSELNASGSGVGSIDTSLPPSTLGSAEVVRISTSPAALFEIEGLSVPARVGESLDFFATAKDSEGNHCFVTEPNWSLSGLPEATLSIQTRAILPPTRNESIGSVKFARVSSPKAGGVVASVSNGTASASINSSFDDFDLSTESTWEGTWTGILEDGRPGFPGETLYTTTIGKPVNGKYPITWMNSFYEPYVFSYEGLPEGQNLTAFAQTVTLSRDGESLVVAIPTAQQIARLRRTNRAVNLRGKIGASRRLSSGNVEVDLILTNESTSNLTGIELLNVRLNQQSMIPGIGSSGWPNGSSFGTLAPNASARRTLTFPSSIPTGVSILGFGVSTQQGRGNSMELRVSIPPLQ